MLGKCLFVAGVVAISGCGAKPLGGQQPIDGSPPDGAQPMSCTDTVEHGCQTQGCSKDWSAAISNLDCTNGTYDSAQCGGYNVLRYMSTNVSMVDPYQTNAYYSQATGQLVAITLRTIGPASDCELGPATGFVVPDCAGSVFVSLCSFDAGAGPDARPADAASYPAPFTDAGCTADPRTLVLYCETPDQLLGTDAGRVVTSPADCPPSSVLASPSPCGAGEGSCCVTPACGPQIQEFSVPSSTPDASATENRCCYLAQVVCGV
jgi:hypothetical protein